MQSYILQLFTFCFYYCMDCNIISQAWIKMVLFFYISKGIFIASKFLTLLQFPIALKDCNSYFQGFPLSGWYHRLPLSFLFLLFYTVFVNQHKEPKVAYKLTSDFFFFSFPSDQESLQAGTKINTFQMVSNR